MTINKLVILKALLGVGGLLTFATATLVISGVAPFVARAQTATEPVISALSATSSDTGATITWTTDENATSQVAYGTTTSYTASTTEDTSQVMDHSVILSGLMPDTMYHFQVMSEDASSSTSTSPDQIFMTTGVATTTTASTTTSTAPDLVTLQNEIIGLQNSVALLEQEVASLLQGGGDSASATSSTAPATIDQNGQTLNAGGSVDFGGRNFSHEETVVVTLGGKTVASAHADGAGNFSTGSLSLPTTPGTYTYTFVGQSSGDSASATITLR